MLITKIVSLSVATSKKFIMWTVSIIFNVGVFGQNTSRIFWFAECVLSVNPFSLFQSSVTLDKYLTLTVTFEILVYHQVIQEELYRNLGLAFLCVMVVTVVLIAHVWTSLLVCSCIVLVVVSIPNNFKTCTRITGIEYNRAKIIPRIPWAYLEIAFLSALKACNAINCIFAVLSF